MSVDDASSGAGFDVRQSHYPEADVRLDAGDGLVALHRSLVDELVAGDDLLVDALREVRQDLGESKRDPLARRLRDAGVDALDGRVADAFATLALATDRDVDAAPAHAHRAAVHLLAYLGAGHVDGQASTTDDPLRALPPLLASTSTTPTVSVRLGVAWSSRRKESRGATLRFLSDLAVGADLRLVVTDAAARRIVDAHAGDVPTWILTRCRDRCQPRQAPAADDETAVDADGSISPTGRPAGVLAALARSSTHSLAYEDLARTMALDRPPYESVRRLSDRALVERHDRADGAAVVSLRPAGHDLAEALDADYGLVTGRSSAVSSRSEASIGSDSAASHTPPKSLPPCRVTRCDRMPPPDPPDRDGTADERPEDAVDAAALADGDRLDNYGEGLIWPRYGGREDWMPALDAVDAGEVGLFDADLSDRLDEDRHGCQPHISYVAEEDAVVAGGEYFNPMAFATSIAHALTCERLLNAEDWADRVGDDLRGLDISTRPVLWSATCLGWLPEDVEDGDDLVDALRGAREDLLDLTGELASDDDDSADRSDVARHALGLIGTVVQLLDLLDVDVRIEMRIPECSRHFSPNGNGDRRDDLLDHLGMLTSLCSRIGAFSIHRQLFEDREDRRSDAFSPGFDDPETPRRGSNRAGIVVVGDGVEDLGEEVVDAIESPRPTHPDAPPIGVDVDVVTGARDDRVAATVRRALRARGLRPTPTATATIVGFVGSGWAAADAVLTGLETEDDRRDVHLDEVRRALSALDADRLLPDAATSARSGLAALVDADRPISQAELARRAGISAQSWRNHRDVLVALDLVRETEDGWRLTLPFRSERREDDVDVDDPPWWLRAETDGIETPNRDVRKPLDVLEHALVWGLGEPQMPRSRSGDPDDPLRRAFQVVERDGCEFLLGNVDAGVAMDALNAIGMPPGLVFAGCGAGATAPPTSTSTMGTTSRQTTLS